MRFRGPRALTEWLLTVRLLYGDWGRFRGGIASSLVSSVELLNYKDDGASKWRCATEHLGWGRTESSAGLRRGDELLPDAGSVIGVSPRVGASGGRVGHA